MTNNPGDPKAAFNCAVDLLSHQDRSEKDLLERLLKRGFEVSAAAEAIIKLKEKHYLDDKRMASHFIATHLSEQSLAQLKYKLMRKGIGSEDIAAAISELDEEAIDESDSLRCRQAVAVLEFLKKKKFDNNDPSRDKILASLSRKGFSYDAIREGMTLFEEEQSGEL